MWKAFLLNLLIAVSGRGAYPYAEDARGTHTLQAEKDAYDKVHPSRYNRRQFTFPSEQSNKVYLTNRIPGSFPTLQSLRGTPLTEFLPYGSNAGDKDLPPRDNVQTELKLADSPFTFFNKTYSSLIVNNNGVITFGKGILEYNAVCGPYPIPLIASFWTDVDTRNGGEVYYRQTTSKGDLDKAKAIVNRAFPATFHNLNIQWAVVVTWKEVGFYGASIPSPGCPGSSLRNTMQAILVQDKKNSFVILLYNKLTWSVGTGADQKGDSCTGRNPTVGNPANAGFNYGDGKTYLPGSCTEEITKITEQSNFLEPGKWAFKVTDRLINTCEIDCSYGDQFQADPYNCSTYYQCSNNVPKKMLCPELGGSGRLVFDPSQNVCVWPSDYACKPICK